MSEEEKKEFTNLKYIRAERGFFLPDEEKRYNELFDLLAISFTKKMKKLNKIFLQIELN